MSIPARLFNKLRKLLMGSQLHPGVNASITRLPHGQIVSALALDASIRHPWFCTLTMQSAEFSVRIQPGFVNGIDPTVLVLNKATNQTASVPLTDDPLLVIPNFEDRTQSGSSDQIPEYFQRLGAARDRSEKITTSGDTIQVIDDSSAQLPGRRRLLSADIYLAVARIGLNGSVILVDNRFGGQNVLYEPTFSLSLMQKYGSRPRIMTAPLWTPPLTPTASQRILEFIGEASQADSDQDELLIATLFLLSPADTPEGVAPDATWTPYFQHSLFFNLLYAPQTLPQQVTPAPITLYTGLAGGIGDLIDNEILSGINDATDALQQGLADSVSQTGKFWSI